MKMRLPGGRGPRTGPDAITDNQEFLLQRKLFVPDQDGFEISVTHPSGMITSGVPVANIVRIYPMMVPEQNYRIVKAQIAINVVSAGGTVRASLYKFDADNVKFINVPGTTASFSTAATGIIAFTFATPFTLYAGTQYFVAFVCDNAVASITVASGGGNSRTRKSYSGTLVLTTAFPAQFDPATMTSNTNANWYQITYLSTAAAKVF